MQRLRHHRLVTVSTSVMSHDYDIEPRAGQGAVDIDRFMNYTLTAAYSNGSEIWSADPQGTVRLFVFLL